jgi:hypothetical protein
MAATKTKRGATARPTAVTDDLESERRWRRLLARQPDAMSEVGTVPEVPEPARGNERPAEAHHRAQSPQERGQDAAARRRVDRVPLRPETAEEEVARYPARVNAWEERRAVAESRRGHEAEDAAHRAACVDAACGHPAHVLERRELRSEVAADRRHLAACPREEPDCLDPSHRLPPHPIDAAVEYCCAHQCFPRHDVRSVTECRYVPTRVRARREAEYRARGAAAFGMPASGVAGAFGVTTSPLSEGTAWAWRGRRIYDPASEPPRA